ncbi:MAG: Cof-type HAD-IIB family hydrolase [Eubacterium sp.]|jgi:HAD-superfamily hydrolase, subfamily IIB|nr:Cof-type HAD-IIB family hydrolase [Eubacterium sp.]
MKKKAIFFDIDGTIVDRRMQIADSTKAAMEKLHENGHCTFICSGRSRAYIKNPELLSLKFDGIIAGCGTHVEVGGKNLVCHVIDKELLSYTWSVLKKSGISPLWEGIEYLYGDEEGLKDDPYYRFLKTQLKENLIAIDGNVKDDWKVNKMSVVIKEDADLGAFEILKEHFHLLQHNPVVAEMVPAGFSKATGLEAVREYLQLGTEDTYAVGDSINDLDMLRAAGTGIAMGNASKEAKEAADYVTTDIHDDGIWNAMRHFGLIS